MKLDKEHLYRLFDNNFRRFNINRHNHLDIYFNTPCIYFLLKNKEVVYIGESECFMQRLNDHRKSNKVFDDYVFYIYKGTKVERLAQESKLIFYYNPIYNITFPYHIKEAYLKSFYKNCKIYYKYDIYIKEDNITTQLANWKDDLKSCIHLLETQTGLNNSIIYSNDKFFIKKFSIFCNSKLKNNIPDDYELLELWENLYNLKKKFNFTLIFKSLNYDKIVKV